MTFHIISANIVINLSLLSFSTKVHNLTPTNVSTKLKKCAINLSVPKLLSSKVMTVYNRTPVTRIPNIGLA